MLRLLPLVSLLVACGSGDDSNNGFTTTTTGNSTGEGTCVELERRTLAIDEFVTEPLNMAPEDALGELSGVSNTTAVFVYPDENSIGLDVAFTYTDGALSYVERDNEGVLPPDEAERCFTAIEIDGTLSFVSAGGEFNETVPVTLHAKARREGLMFFTIAESALVGTWTPALSGIDAAAFPNLQLDFEGKITNLGSEGTITGVSGSSEAPAGSWNPPPTQG